MKLHFALTVFLTSCCWQAVHAQTTANVFEPGNGAAVQVFPTIRPMRWLPPEHPTSISPVRVKSVASAVDIDGQQARTTIEVVITNSNARQQEAEILIPVPLGTALRSFDLDGVEGKLNGKLLPREEARRIYDSIVRRVKDPGLLEFAGDGLLRSSVFPIPANGSASVKIVYEQWLPRDGNRIDYVLPRSEALEYEIPWEFSLRWKFSEGLKGIFSPSHEFDTESHSDGSISLRSAGGMQSGAVRVSALVTDREDQTLGATIYSYPELHGEDGYFLLVLQASSVPLENPPPRDITFVFDRSGSMAGEKMEQTRAAALQVLETLTAGDTFNIVAYNEGVQPLFSKSEAANAENLLAARRFIQATRVSGGTNIHDALVQALENDPGSDRFPAVIFLTDGIPTIGETREKAITQAVADQNSGTRRIFPFGVGVDLNTPLLARIAEITHGAESLVLPGQNVEVPVSALARRLQGVLAVNPKIQFSDPGRVDDVLPRRMPDIFVGDQVLILGRYRGQDPIDIEFKTRATGSSQSTFSIKIQIDPAKSTTAAAFVPRLWAMRKIATLTSALRDLGAGSTQLPPDARTQELVDEIVRLSLAHGILTEYTAFLAANEVPVSASAPQNRREAEHRFESRALRSRTGADAVNQELNLIRQRESAVVLKDNRHISSTLTEDKEKRVQQIADKAFLLRDGVWQDSEIDSPIDAQDILIGTPAFDNLVTQLIAANRQGVLALSGDILIREGTQLYRIRSAR